MSEPLGKMSGAPGVLVVEDEPLISMLVSDWLIELGCNVIGPVNNSADALTLIETEKIDALLLDVTLGSGDSFSLADVALAKDLRIAFITGRSAADMPARFKTVAVLAKPFEFVEVKAMLDRLLQGSPRPLAPGDN